MKIIVAAAALALAAGGAAFAQDHADHHPGVKEAKRAAADAQMHEQCKAYMGRQMDPKQPHDHGRDKTGAATWPGGKPLSPAEMKAMHDKCQALMAKESSTAAAPSKR